MHCSILIVLIQIVRRRSHRIMQYLPLLEVSEFPVGLFFLGKGKMDSGCGCLLPPGRFSCSEIPNNCCNINVFTFCFPGKGKRDGGCKKGDDSCHPLRVQTSNLLPLQSLGQIYCLFLFVPKSLNLYKYFYSFIYRTKKIV